MKEKSTVSMNDIAEMAGVSVATVSRIINRNGRYSKETECRVRALIEKYHYAPNMAAKGLKTRRSKFIGVIVPDISNEFFARIVQAMQDVLRTRGYIALVCNTDEDEIVEEQYVDILSTADLAGLIFVSGSTHTAEKGLRSLPTIYIDRASADLREAIVVESDNFGGACMAVEELCEKGCKRIACLHPAKVISTHAARYDGYKAQLKRRGLPASDELNIQVEQISFRAAQQAVETLLDKGVVFDGIFCTSDWLALGAVKALEGKGLQVPQDVKVVGFDDVSMAEFAAKPLTTVHQQTKRLGETAAEKLLCLIDGETAGAQHIRIGVSLVQRQTT